MNVHDVHNATKKIETLDVELNTFLEAVKEIKEIRDTIEILPTKLKNSEEELEGQKKELEDLISSANKLLTELAEHANDVIVKIAKKTDAMTEEVRSGISKMGNLIQEGKKGMKDDKEEKLEKLTKKMIDIQNSYDRLMDEQKKESSKTGDLGNNSIVWVAAIIVFASTIIAVSAFYLR